MNKKKMNEWINDWINELMYEWINEWMNVTKIFYCYDTNEKRKELFFSIRMKKNVKVSKNEWIYER